MVRILFSLIILLLSIINAAQAQEKRDLGVMGGASYYFGDFNPGTQFNEVSPAFGLMLRYNHNPFYSFRLTGAYGTIRGQHSQDEYYLPPYSTPTRSFSENFFSLEIATEAGFMSFDTQKPFGDNFTPYIMLGFGCMVINARIIPSMPMGFGGKLALGKRWTVGVEWRINKTMYDEIDGYDFSNSSESSKSYIHNNDWFGFGGLHLTYRLENNRAICPAYR